MLVKIIDDCSSDNTRKILLKKKINFLKNNKNIGYEASVIKGIKYILKYWKKTKYVVTIDADGELPTNAIPFLLRHLVRNNTDVIVGERNKMNSRAGSHEIKCTNAISQVFILFLIVDS